MLTPYPPSVPLATVHLHLPQCIKYASVQRAALTQLALQLYSRLDDIDGVIDAYCHHSRRASAQKLSPDGTLLHFCVAIHLVASRRGWLCTLSEGAFLVPLGVWMRGKLL